MRSAQKISVIIPCFNQGRFLHEAIKSLLGHACEPSEIIVVNDGSSDDTADVAKSFGGSVRLIEQNNRGLPCARNRGLAESSGDWVLFLDADDMLAPGALGAFHAIAGVDQDAGVLYGGCEYVDAAGTFIRRNPPPQMTGDAFHWLLRRNRFPCHSVCVRRDLVNAAGGFCESLTAHEDWDLWLRLAAVGARFVAVPDACAMYRRYPQSMSRNIGRMQSTGLEVLCRNSSVHGNCRTCKAIVKEASFEFRVLPYFGAVDDRKMSFQTLLAAFAKCAKKDPLALPPAAYYAAVYGMRYMRGSAAGG